MRSLAEHIQIWGFEGDSVVFSDSSFGFGLELFPLDPSCWDDSECENYSEKIRRFLNGLPAEIDLQFLIDIGKGNENILSNHLALSKSRIEIANELTSTRVNRYKGLEKNHELPKFTLRCFVRRPASKSILKKNFLLSKKHFERISEENLNNELSHTEKLRADLIQGLNGIQIEAKVLSAQQIAQLFYEQWNPGRNIAMPSFNTEDFRSELLFTDANIDIKGFSLGGVHHRVLSLKRLPENTFATMSTKLAELPFSSRTFLSIKTLNQEKEISKLQTQRRLAHAMAKGKSGVSDIDSESKLEDLESLLEAMIAQGEKIFKMSLNIILKSTSEEELENLVTDTLIALRNLSGAEAMEESLAAFDVFTEFSIPNSRATERAKWIETSSLANFVPLHMPWAGYEKPSILLRSRYGNLITLDPFDKELTNFNHIVTGGSGAGKSFLTNLLLLQMLKEN